MTSCSCCFTDTLAKCETEIKLNIILPVYGSYRWVITDKFGNKYQGDLNAEQTIPIDELPAGLLTQYNGTLKLEIFNTDEACAPVQFLAASKYECIEFDITPGNFEKNNLGCEITGTTPGDDTLVYEEYVALLSQSGTNAPVPTILHNTIGAIVWARSGVGVYTGTKVGAFTANKTLLLVNGPASSFSVFTRLSDDVVQLSTGSDSIIVDTPIQIRVYP